MSFLYHPYNILKCYHHCNQLWLPLTKMISTTSSFFHQKVTTVDVPVNAQPVDKNAIKKKPRSRIPLVNWFRDDFLRGTIKMNAFFIYADMTNDINYFLFFKTFQMDDTFNSWFLVTELHTWMLLARLRQAGKDGKVASESLVTALWDDTTVRAKVLSPGDSSTSKRQIGTLSQEFKASLLIYDEGLLGSDTVLASALWYRLLSMACDDPRLLEILIVYVRQQIQNLDNTSAEDILLRTKVKWKPLLLQPHRATLSS